MDEEALSELKCERISRAHGEFIFVFSFLVSLLVDCQQSPPSLFCVCCLCYTTET